MFSSTFLSLLTVCSVRVIAARGIFSSLLLALHLSERPGEGQERERERDVMSEKYIF